MFTAFMLALAILIDPAAQARNTIEGRVTTQGNRPISNARIFLQNEGYSPIGSTISDGSGRFRFTNLRSGIYTVQVEPMSPDFERQSQRIEVQAFNERRGGGGEIFRVDIVLMPRKSPGPSPSTSAANPNAILFHQEIPEEAKKEYERGVRLAEKGSYMSATESLKKAIGIFPDYYDALELLGTEYVKHNDYQAALPLLTRAITVHNEGWRSFYSLGVAQLETAHREEGIKSLRRAAELNPDSPNINMRLGMTLAQDDSARGEAIQALKKVTEAVKGGIPQAYFYLGVLYGRNHQYREAADNLEMFLRAYPQAGEKEKIKMMIEELRQKAKEAHR